jgi:drug/metabolite transporter (DMT)-like permease
MAQQAPATAWSPLVLACLAATWVIWGSTYLAIRFSLAGLPPFFGMGTRFVVAGGVLLLWVHGRGAPAASLRQWRNALIIGGLMLGGGMGCTAFAEQTVPSGLTVAFIAVVPALVTVFSLPFGLKPTILEVAGLTIGLAGTLLLSRGAGFGASPTGLLALSFACTCWSLGSVLSQQNFKLAPGGPGYGAEMLCGGLVLLTISALRHEPVHWPIPLTAGVAWGYLVIFGSLIAFTAYMKLLGSTSPAIAASYTFVNPVIGLLLGISLGSESVSVYEWLAVGVILAGLALLLFGRQRRGGH